MPKTNTASKFHNIPISIAKAILIVLRETGSITIDSFFHNSHARRFGFGHGPKYYNNYYRTVHRLRANGFIKKEDDIYKLTSLGEKEAFFSFLKTTEYAPKNNTVKWDKKWRIIFFDVPEKRGDIETS